VISVGYGETNEPARRLYERLGSGRAAIPPQRVHERIWIQGRPLDVNETMIYLVKQLDVARSAIASLGRTHVPPVANGR